MVEEKVCEEREKRCYNNLLQQCSNNTWTTIETCDYGCNITTLTGNPEPTGKVCTQGTKRCFDDKLQECKDNK